MNRKLLLVLSSLFIVGCSASNASSLTNDSSLNTSESSSLSNDGSSLLSSVEAGKSSSTPLSSSDRTSRPGGEDEQAVDSYTAQQLIVYASSVDMLRAQSSSDLLLAKGFDNGIRYEQTQTVEYISYSNDITIGLGSLEHQQSGKIYTDTFDHVKMVKDYTLIDATKYHNGVFNDTTQKTNLMNSTDPSGAYASALKSISCGAGYAAYEDFYYAAITLQSEIYYEAYYENDSRLHIIFYAEAVNEQSNQLFLGQYEYYFNSIEDGFLTEYISEQAFYSYDYYVAAKGEDIPPMYYALEMITVNSGSKTKFDGVLPIDVDSTFVKSITLSAAITTIEVDEVIALKADVQPKTATDKSLKFASSNESVARVDYTGRIVGISPGKCTISAYNYASGVEGTIEITVISKHTLEPGDDSKKGDLQEALSLAKTQYLPIERIYHDTIVGMIIDEDSPLNGEELAKLSISDFAWNEKTRTATYVGDVKVLEKIIPFLDNGNNNLSNRYTFEKGNYIYRDTILGMEIELDALNRIGVVHFKMRTDSCARPSGLNVASLTDSNVETILKDFSAGYARDVYYESEGFYSDETNDNGEDL